MRNIVQYRLNLVFLLAITATAGQQSYGSIAINFDPSGGGVGLPTGSLDYAPGNSLALGGTTAIETFFNTLPPGQNTGGVQIPIQTLYQASLTGIKDANGVDITPAGLNTTYKIGAVGAFQEVVTSLVGAPGTLGSTSVLSVIPGGDNYFELYQSPLSLPPFPSSDLLGTGFNDGTLILSADVVSGFSTFSLISPSPVSLDQFGANDYAANLTAGVGDASQNQLTVTGQGNTTLTAVIRAGGLAPNFFPTPVAPGTAITLEFASTLNDPFRQINPSAQFLWSGNAGAGPYFASALGVLPTVLGAGLGAPSGSGGGAMGAGIGLVNGSSTAAGGGPDIQFQADASNSFDQIDTIPEPASVFVWAVLASVCGAVVSLRRRV